MVYKIRSELLNEIKERDAALRKPFALESLVAKLHQQEQKQIKNNSNKKNEFQASYLTFVAAGRVLALTTLYRGTDVVSENLLVSGPGIPSVSYSWQGSDKPILSSDRLASINSGGKHIPSDPYEVLFGLKHPYERVA